MTPVRLLSRLVGRQGEAHSSKNDEMRAPSEMWKAILDEHRAQIAALTTRLIAQRRELRWFHERNSRGNEFAYARGKKEAEGLVAELRSALEEIRARCEHTLVEISPHHDEVGGWATDPFARAARKLARDVVALTDSSPVVPRGERHG